MIAPNLDTEKYFCKAIDTENKYSGSIMASLIEPAPKNLTKVSLFCSKQKNQLVLLMINQILHHWKSLQYSTWMSPL